jgi:hypothetical protein
MDDYLVQQLRQAQFDDAKAQAAASEPVWDGADYAATDIRLSALGVLSEWVDTDASDLDAGEGMAQRLTALVYGIADEQGDNDGDVTEDEQAIVDVASNAIATAMREFGAEESDISALLEHEDEDAASNIVELLKGTMPDDDGFIDNFVFGDGSDAALFDAVYKKTFAIRNGKKKLINKRISGSVRLSAKRKAALAKAQRRSHSSAAKIKRLKSFKRGMHLHKTS